jgi:hypothetical protein
LADHEIDEGIETRNVLPEWLDNLENKCRGQKPKEFAPMARVNSPEPPAKSNESMLPRLCTSRSLDEMPD